MIRNYSSGNVIINREFWEGPGSNIESDTAWHQTIYNIPLSIRDMLSVVRTNIVRSNQSLSIINYFPLGPIGQRDYDGMHALPFMDKMRAIFKNLEIISNNGERIITLDNLGDIVIKRMVITGGVWYMLEIFDYDLIGRPGSEW
jgi:hypothetical protein